MRRTVPHEDHRRILSTWRCVVRLTFITGTPRSVQLGSGTYVGIEVLRRTLEALGHQVRMVIPRSTHAPFGLTAWRLGFNVALAARYRSTSDLTVGFDMDGFLLPPRRTGPYLVSIKGVLADELTFERGAVRRLLALQAWCEARNVRRSPRVITTSHYAASRIAEHYAVSPERIRQVPELIDLERAGGRSETVAELAAAPAAGGEPMLLAVAHLYPRKSIADLLRAVALLPPRWRHVRLHVVGLGPEWARLQALTDQLGLRARVSFLGHISRARLAVEYRQCAIFCLPSRQEGFGIVYLEAMAAGRAIVACQAAAVPEIVEDGVTGLLTKPGDPTALAGALTELLDDPARRARLGEAGRERVRDYAAPVVARRFLEVAEEARAYGSS
jgi:glycosyltransferase involved in cell wall biosynthesis